MKKRLISLIAALQSTYVTTALAGHTVIEENGGDLVLKPGTFPSLNGNLSDTVHHANEALERAVNVGDFIFAIIMLVLLALLIVNISKIASSGDDERMRKEAIKKLLFTLGSITLMGSIGIIVALSRGII